MKYFIAILLTAVSALAADMKYNAETVSKDPLSEMTILKGHASVSQDGRKISADQIEIDPVQGFIRASGNCKYENGKKITENPKMTFKLDNDQWIYIQKNP